MWFAIAILAVAVLLTLITLVYRQVLNIRVPSPEEGIADVAIGLGRNIGIGVVAGAISWIVLRRASGERFAEWLVEAAAGPAVVSILSIPLIILFQWSMAVVVIAGFVLGSLGFALSGFLTRPAVH